MDNITFDSLDLSMRDTSINKIKINESIELEVKSYLPIDEKVNLIKFIVDGALDDSTGCFSPLRVEVYFAIAICRWYANIDFSFDNLVNISKVYDILETNSIIDNIIDVIPSDEMNFLNELVRDTINDIARYNSSAAGIIKAMTVDADSLDGQINNILEKIKNGEGLEALSVIKDAVGTD